MILGRGKLGVIFWDKLLDRFDDYRYKIDLNILNKVLNEFESLKILLILFVEEVELSEI